MAPPIATHMKRNHEAKRTTASRIQIDENHALLFECIGDSGALRSATYNWRYLTHSLPGSATTIARSSLTLSLHFSLAIIMDPANSQEADEGNTSDGQGNGNDRAPIRPTAPDCESESTPTVPCSPIQAG